MTTETAANPAEDPVVGNDGASFAPAPTADATAPRFEQTMQGLLSMLQSMPRDEAVTNGFLMDWLLPLFEDARDEYHSLATENSDQIAVLAEEVDEVADNASEAPRPVDEGTRQVVIAAVGLAAVAYQRAGWMDKDLKITSKCPKDLAEEYTKVQKFVQAWASGVDVAAISDATGE